MSSALPAAPGRRARTFWRRGNFSTAASAPAWTDRSFRALPPTACLCRPSSKTPKIKRPGLRPGPRAYLIDTNIAIHARDGTDAVLAKLAEHDGEVLLSAVSLAELQRGAYRDPSLTAIRQVRLEVLLRGLPVLPFDASAAVDYGRIIAQCGWARRRDYDRMIAAHAINSHSIFVTEQLGRFQRHSRPVHGELGGLRFCRVAKPIEK